MLSQSFKKQHCLAKHSPELPTALIPVARPLSIQEVADYFSVNPKTVRNWIAVGKLNAHRYGRLIRINPLDIESLGEAVNPVTYDHVRGGGL